MTHARAAAIGVALIAMLSPATTTSQAAPEPLWLAPTGKPTAATTAFLTAVNQLADDKPAPALPVFSKAISDPVIGGYALLMQGRAQLALRKPAEAKFTAEQLLKVEPRDYLREAAYLLAADVAEAQGDAQGEMRALQGAAEMKPIAGAAMYLRLGRAAKQAGDRLAARGAFNKVAYEFALSAEAPDALAELAALADPGAVPSRETFSLDFGRGGTVVCVQAIRGCAQDLRGRATCGCGRRARSRGAAHCAVRSWPEEVRGCARRLAAAARSRRAPSRGALLDARRVARSGPRCRVRHRNPQGRHRVSGERRGPKPPSTISRRSTFSKMMMPRRRRCLPRCIALSLGANAERAAWRSGWWAYLKGNYAETARVFDHAFSRFARSDYRSAWSYWSARSRQQLGQRDGAAEGYRRVISLYQNSYYGREATRGLAAMTGQTVSTVAKVKRDAPLVLAPGAMPPNARLITRLLEVGLYDDAIGELKRTERDQGPSPMITATIAYAWNRKGELRTAINLMKRAYPQFMAAGGESLPTEIRRVIFPMAYWDLIQEGRGGPQSGSASDGRAHHAGIDVSGRCEVGRKRVGPDADSAVHRTQLRGEGGREAVAGAVEAHACGDERQDRHRRTLLI